MVVGASAGALEALSVLLPALPTDYPLPVLVVVHLPPDKKSVMAELLQQKCRVGVREAEDKEPIRAGIVYFAPPDYHLLVEPDRRLSLSSEEPVLYSRPSIDVLFETAADAYGPGLIGVVLTGANSDGSRGLRAVLSAGGTGLVQWPDLAYASAMPQAALDACPGARVLSLPEIATYLLECVTPV
ncbi:Chemotaxis response regulator protein-glutamate methylesterase CheB [Fimbriiglobus ruber]|uniref:protein-glutamate methylesterase n=1 Tax=Fimbriiglobus ruber TaxID=1908690 RepID=A0A225DZL1_9BACT|nr:Chemotaxis response regulator protein-glutamate methylesterase CheB [Fimbriiglobus ruber]